MITLLDNWAFCNYNTLISFFLNPRSITLNITTLLEQAKSYLVHNKLMDKNEQVIGQVLCHLDSYKLRHRARLVVEMVKSISRYQQARAKGDLLESQINLMQIHGYAYLATNAELDL
jgi:hypothetical protein